MNQNYIIPDAWCIIEEGFEKDRVMQSESLFSLGNGAMGQRTTFEEKYSGKTFQGSYIGGVYYPDKTKVGWWKNGYPEYFAKVLNAPSWVGINVTANGEALDLNTASVRDFKRVLNMKEGVYVRSFVATLPNGLELKVEATRFLSMQYDEVGVIRYEVTPLNTDAEINFESYLDSSIENHDTNWEEKFWNTLEVQHATNKGFIVAETKKTAFRVCTFMENQLEVGGQKIALKEAKQEETYVGLVYNAKVGKGQTARFEKFAGYVTSFNHPKEKLIEETEQLLLKIKDLGFDKLLRKQKEAWAEIWKMADITIEGDVKAQQAIRFNIFQLNQTYSGKDPRLNIGPKGFTGEKYGGSTYWDTEAYCLPFYMATKNAEVARNLLKYRYDQLGKAIENAEKLGFKNGAALYPMVTMNGEECHNEWEITFEEIHRNGAIAFAIYNYVRYTGDFSYVPEMGLEVLIGIARFWHQRATYSAEKEKFVILGVTGPNEYENNINNNFYTNYIAAWCIKYAKECLDKVAEQDAKRYAEILEKTKLSAEEVSKWMGVAENMYYPYSQKYNVYLQQDGFLDKELITVAELDKKERPINQHWSWDRILRSPYIKQADTLQGFYFFEDQFTKEELQRHFDFYEPFTVHESSLSPCVHSILAASLGRMEQAYTFYLRTSRLDLDDYNKEVHEGLHITSMAGTWMSIVEGFGGLRMRDGKLHFTPQIPNQWEGYSFKVNFRGQILQVSVTKKQVKLSLEGTSLSVNINGKDVTVENGKEVEVNL
ncbi:glycoside hydrolase family 65 protein [Capnocytophaga stomatis]|uniref:Glycoside hydrolase family 65 protein n=1 Tax=Capnocytophaga stomatis TaxID=1848904 RepID=A0ABW8QAT5_9FLAO|nr:glycoside hydrolase family 65 protein [Capnocytophaga stomatis]GIJ93637.1 maltose phosphorylase [Capnocytophaga stomatis]